MPSQFDAFSNNPFSGDARYSRERKVRFGYDNAARLQSLDAAAFAAEISATIAVCQQVEAALGHTGSAVGIGRGLTRGTDAALATYREVVGSKYNVVRDRLGKKSDVITTVFGDSIQRFTQELTKTNAAARMEELGALLAAHAAAVGADVVDAIQAAADAYTGKRTVQRAKLGDVGTAQVGAQGAETTLDQQLWRNACRVVLVYPSAAAADHARRAAAANFSLLERPATGQALHLAGAVTPQGLVNLLDPADESEQLQPDTALKLANTGAADLRFSLSKSATDPGDGPVVTLGLGERRTLKASELGDVVTTPYLNVVNSSTDAPGAYEVTVG